MNRLWRFLGTTAFWLSWPLLWLSLYNSQRSRLLLIHNGRVLVVRNSYGDGSWGLPGGGLHAKETPLQALHRELYEELRLTLPAQVVKVLGSAPTKDKGFRVTLHYFVAEVAEPPVLTRRRLEISDVAWLTPDTLATQKTAPEVQRALAAWSGSSSDLLQ